MRVQEQGVQELESVSSDIGSTFYSSPATNTFRSSQLVMTTLSTSICYRCGSMIKTHEYFDLL
jgi:hypothetical protein